MLIAQVTPAVLLLVTVAQGAMSNIEEPRQVVVRTGRRVAGAVERAQP